MESNLAGVLLGKRKMISTNEIDPPLELIDSMEPQRGKLMVNKS